MKARLGLGGVCEPPAAVSMLCVCSKPAPFTKQTFIMCFPETVYFSRMIHGHAAGLEYNFVFQPLRTINPSSFVCLCLIFIMISLPLAAE